MTLSKGLMVGAIGVLAASAFNSSAMAAVYYPTSVTATSQIAGFEAVYAIDQGAGSQFTDWAASTSVGAKLDMSFAVPLVFTDANVTDRVTSGGPGNGTFGDGTIDFTTEYSIQAFTDSTFTTPVGSAITNTVTTPAAPQAPADFETTLNLGGLTAQYLQYTILASGNGAPGLSNIDFDATPLSSPIPEPASMLVLVVGLAGTAFVRSRRNPAI